jgi:hypothetical protein
MGFVALDVRLFTCRRRYGDFRIVGLVAGFTAEEVFQTLSLGLSSAGLQDIMSIAQADLSLHGVGFEMTYPEVCCVDF